MKNVNFLWICKRDFNDVDISYMFVLKVPSFGELWRNKISETYDPLVYFLGTYKKNNGKFCTKPSNNLHEIMKHNPTIPSETKCSIQLQERKIYIYCFLQEYQENRY